MTFAADRNDHVGKSFTTPNSSSRIVHPETRRCAFSFPLSILQCRSPHQQSKDELAYHLTAHLRLNAVYWGYTALAIMNHPDALDREQMIDFVMSCWDEEAGITGFFLCSPHLIILHSSLLIHIPKISRSFRCPPRPRRAPPLNTQRYPNLNRPRRA